VYLIFHFPLDHLPQKPSNVVAWHFFLFS
jgi:hypothetical protein